MEFVDNKYTKLYYKIINNAKNKTIDGYSEKHHIIPKSLNGTDDINNIVCLTAREHFICHRLLTKMTEGKNKRKMWHALRCFLRRGSKNPRKDVFINNRTYELISRQQAIAASIDHKGVYYWNNGEVQVKSKTKPSNEFQRGRLIKGKCWWTDGINNTLSVLKPLGKNWIKGRTMDKTKVKWTNGKTTKMSNVCPGVEWYKGGLKHTAESKEKIKEKRKHQKNVKGKIQH